MYEKTYRLNADELTDYSFFLKVFLKVFLKDLRQYLYNSGFNDGNKIYNITTVRCENAPRVTHYLIQNI